jgi:putative hydroxymethylpyrimidine transport system substrate-binding protein
MNSKLLSKLAMLWHHILLCLGLLLATSPCVRAAPPPLQPLTVVLDWYINPNHGPLVIAQADGLFARHGLDVTLVAPADPNDAPKLVAAGKADVGVGYQTQLHMQVAQGLLLVRVGALIDQPLSVILTRADSGIRTLADLRGSKVGYSASGVEEAILHAVLSRHGLGLSDIQLINVNYALTPALLTRQVDAVVGAYRNVEVPQLRQAGVTPRIFALEDEGVPARDALIFIANPDRLNRAALRSFLAAVGEATARIRADADGTFATFSTAYPEADHAANRTAWTLTVPYFAHNPAHLDPERYQAVPRFLVGSGLIPQVLPVARYAIALD